MKIIKPSATLMKHNVTPYQFIEKVGRTCYKSEEYITDGSAEKFVAGLVKREHMAMLEHETIYLVMSYPFMKDFLYEMNMVDEHLKFFNITHNIADNVLSGSFRSFYELFGRCAPTNTLEIIKRGLKATYPLVFGGFEDERIYMNYPKESCVPYDRQKFIDKFSDIPYVLFTHLTHTFKFVCDRGVTHEFVRHRDASFAQESTRYCNYSKDKFGNEITVIEPFFFDADGIKVQTNNWSERYGAWRHSCEVAEESYFRILDDGGTPQEARTVLPNSLKTELIVTATEKEWQHIVNLRYLGTTGAPHPQIKEVMGLAISDLIEQTNNRVKGVKEDSYGN